MCTVGASSSAEFFVNGEKYTDGKWKTSDGEDFVRFQGYSYKMKNGMYVSIQPKKRFLGAAQTRKFFGFICEK